MLPTQTVRNQSTKYGLVTILAGMALLLGLRWWTSPLVLKMLGRRGKGLVEFLMIPVFLAVVAAGVLLFLWEPSEDR